MADKSCECCESTVHIARNFEEARRLSRYAATMGRALIHEDWVLEELPKLGECLSVDFSETVRLLEKARTHMTPEAEPEKATETFGLAWRSFSRTIRKCAEKP